MQFTFDVLPVIWGS